MSKVFAHRRKWRYRYNDKTTIFSPEMAEPMNAKKRYFSNLPVLPLTSESCEKSSQGLLRENLCQIRFEKIYYETRRFFTGRHDLMLTWR